MKAIGITKTAAIAVAVLVCAWAFPATAGVADLGLGWQASWDASLDGLVDVNASEVNGVLFIEKSAQFQQGPVNGVFPSIVIQFQQVASPATTSIVIDDEIITNSTGTGWTDFHIGLVDTSGGTVFNPVKTLAAGGTGPIHWTIAPFLQAAFSTDLLSLDIWDGVLPNGANWFPGSGAQDGQLWIDLTPNPNNTASFVLVETPTPEPATLSLLALGGLALIRRRR